MDQCVRLQLPHRGVTTTPVPTGDTQNTSPPWTASVTYDDTDASLHFANRSDATQFIHAQARAATAAGAQRFCAAITADDGATITTVDVSGRDLASMVAAATDNADGLVTMSVAGINAATVYAHRSQTIPGALLVGVEAETDQRILFVVNDGELADTTVGKWTGTLDLSAMTVPTSWLAVTATVDADSAAQAIGVLEALACCQPVHIRDVRTAHPGT